MTKQKLILIGGPTASGKSALALRLARELGGAVLNADAMQVYAGLPLLTAQPEAADRAAAPHLLYEIFDPSEAGSAGKWAALAREAIRDALRQSLTPILVGGTGLYFRALLGGLAEIPPVPEAVRAEAQALYDTRGEEAFRALLAALDPDSARKLARNDRQRLIRAYEVARATGKPLGFWQKENRAPTLEETLGLPLDIERHLVLPPREALYAACDRRFLTMMERGALDEVRALTARNLSPDLPAMKILGVRELAAALRGETSLAEAVAKAQQATRNYAKRQMTWFRNQWN